MANASSSTSGIPRAGAEPPEPWDDMLLVGVVARAQGNKGEVVVNSTTDFADERFAAGAEVWCRRVGGTPERITVQAFRMHLGRPVLRLRRRRLDRRGRGVRRRRAAGAGRGAAAAAGARVLPPRAGRMRGVDLGRRASRARWRRWTAVARRRAWSCAAAGGEVLVPFVQAFCSVDRAGRRIEIAPPEGLLDVNGAWRA